MAPLIDGRPPGLNWIAVIGDPFTLRFHLTLPDGVVLSDGVVVLSEDRRTQPTMTVDAQTSTVVASWTSEDTASQVWGTGSWTLLVSLDAAPLTSLAAGKGTWNGRGSPGASTSLNVPLTVSMGETVIEIDASLSGPPGGVSSVNGSTGPVTVAYVLDSETGLYDLVVT